jgi:integrase
MNQHRTSIPSYRLHKASGQAIVTLDGRDHYLGPHSSPESRARYRRLIHRYLAGETTHDAHEHASAYTVAELCRDYLDFAERTYRDGDGMPTQTVESVRYALRELFEFAADVGVDAFGPRLFAELRDLLAKRGLARSTVNGRIKVIRRAFKWAVEQERAGPSVFHGLLAVGGLRRGRSPARETEPVRPVPDGDIAAALPYMPPPVRAMVELQLLTGARPGEIVLLRGCDIERTGQVWVFRPVQHKNAWREHAREIYLGPKAQAILTLWLRWDRPEAFTFSPRESERRRREFLRVSRRTPLWPSHLKQLAERASSRSPRTLAERYEVEEYRQAIQRACAKAGVTPWSPNRLRHNAATQLRREHGLDVAKAVLGHRLVETTQVYAEIDRRRAMETMERVG